MEFKKQTIIWEDNNEPPKDYIWVKSDKKVYEYDYNQRKWMESKNLSIINNNEPSYSTPLFINGLTSGDGYFKPDENQPSWQEAVNAFLSGRMLK